MDGKIRVSELDHILQGHDAPKHVRDAITSKFAEGHGDHIDKKELDKAMKELKLNLHDGIGAEVIDKYHESLNDRINGEFSKQ